MSLEKYRPNVGIFMLNNDRRILLCERSDVAGAWQPPQGGVEPGEDISDAMLRELEEEVGKHNVELLDSLPDKLYYKWPKQLWKDGYIGQEQSYYLVKKTCSNAVQLNYEFRDYQWVTASAFRKLVSGFKAEVYLKALDLFYKRNPKAIA